MQDSLGVEVDQDGAGHQSRHERVEQIGGSQDIVRLLLGNAAEDGASLLVFFLAENKTLSHTHRASGWDFASLFME